jgi:hypothetical protein
VTNTSTYSPSSTGGNQNQTRASCQSTGFKISRHALTPTTHPPTVSRVSTRVATHQRPSRSTRADGHDAPSAANAGLLRGTGAAVATALLCWLLFMALKCLPRSPCVAVSFGHYWHQCWGPGCQWPCSVCWLLRVHRGQGTAAASFPQCSNS